MEFRDNAAIASFRDEVRDWINNDLSAEEREFDDFGMSPDDRSEEHTSELQSP